MLESIVSGHKVNLIRPRLDEKLEVIRFDPWSKFELLFKSKVNPFKNLCSSVRTMCIYKEKKKIRSM